MKMIFLVAISIIIVVGCNQPQNDKSEKTIENELINDVENINESNVSLSVERNVFKLPELPETVEVTITNNTKDTITTGLHYRIENYENNKWKEVSPEQFFNDLGWSLKPSDRHAFDTNLLIKQIDYKAGKYRISKYYIKPDYHKTKEQFDVYAEFIVE